ncbi:unnamed protein product [Durusdinium trenchii]|uniref:C3H1-type domain-containing protein n=1 Tax=Durusdinium trenchii TaxID=1381693 RepID=A0ABP0L9X7_9DINO
MDIEFQYQHTFITAIIKEPQPDDRRRACSLPPMGSEIEVTAAQLEEKDKEGYVARLASRFGRNDGRHEAAAETRMPVGISVEPEVLLEPTLPSHGSVGHPHICRRPCVYFRTGDCKHGSSCGFCHLEHSERLPKLDKNQRGLMKCLSETQVLAMMARYLRLIAAKQSFELQATEVIELVEHELALQQDQGPGLEEIPEQTKRKLHKTLSRMYFAGIVGLASREQVRPEFRQELADALERLRVAAPQSVQSKIIDGLLPECMTQAHFLQEHS